MHDLGQTKLNESKSTQNKLIILDKVTRSGKTQLANSPSSLDLCYDQTTEVASQYY